MKSQSINLLFILLRPSLRMWLGDLLFLTHLRIKLSKFIFFKRFYEISITESRINEIQSWWYWYSMAPFRCYTILFFFSGLYKCLLEQLQLTHSPWQITRFLFSVMPVSISNIMLSNSIHFMTVPFMLTE